MRQKVKLKGALRYYLRWPLFFTILLILFNIPAYMAQVRLGLFMTGFTAAYFVAALLLYIHSKPAILSECVNFATQYGTVQKELLDSLEVPYALMDSGGKLLWMNQEFMRVTGKNKGYHKSITSIFPVITRERIEKAGEEIQLKLSYEGRFYRVSMDKIHFEGMGQGEALALTGQDGGKAQYLTVLYLFDETQLQQCITENEEQKLVCALAYIDNYEEALASIEEVKRSLLVALVDRKVNKYFSDRDSIVKKLEKDKFFIIFRQKHLEGLIADKFSVLEEVKTIRVGNEMAVTLSIGLGVGGAGYGQNYEYARMSIDLALGRGGDQAVVKDGEVISYYGGNARQVEKVTRVKARVKAYALHEIMESKDRVIIMGHCISDVDSFGAAIGVYCAARAIGKKAHIVLNEITSSLRPLVGCFTEDKGYPPDMFVKNEKAMEIVSTNTVVMVVDTNRPNYTECPELLRHTKTIVVFDHHRQGPDVINNAILSYIETYASSTCEMIAEVLQYFSKNIHLSSSEADCIYAGILIDTDNFNTKTGVRTFEAAAYLRRCGAEVTRVRKLLRDDMSAYKARAEVVRQAEVYLGVFAVSVCLPGKLESPTIVSAQAANELLNIIGIKASFVLTEFNGKIYVSSRSIDEINVQQVMERLGGGGHLNMAGAQIVGSTLDDATRLVKQVLKQMVDEGEIKL